MVDVEFPCLRSIWIKLLFAQTVPVLLCWPFLMLFAFLSLSCSLYPLLFIFPWTVSLFRYLLHAIFLFCVLLHVLLIELDLFSINTSPNCFTLPSSSVPLLLVSAHSHPRPFISLSSPGCRSPLLLSSPLPPHLLSAVAGCCGCEEGRCSNSQMCESAESKAVSLTHSSLQVQVIAALCANVILLTKGIQSNIKKSYFSSSGLKYYRHH